ncbi:MAG: copper transporter [Rariglobus sp.]|jgi:NADH dehydrogenase|nr:copper transporter [Rariglobus sp.]
MHYDVVIAGGGFAGAYCAKTLGKLLGKDASKRVALIAENNVMVFQPMLAEVAGSSLAPLDVVNPLRQLCRHVDVLQGTIQHIDWSRKTLLVDGGRFTRNHEIGFKQLVLTLGSVTDLSRVPGMAEYGRPMKSVSDALRLRAAVINRLEEANLVSEAALRARLLTVVVAGGGYTGVETAGQLLDFMEGSRKYYANLRDTPVRVVLVHGHDRLLAEIGPELGEYARCVLEKRGMEMRLKTRVAEITADRVIFADGDFIEAHTIVTTIGNAPNPVVLGLCEQLGLVTDRGRIRTEATLRVAGHPDLWTAGDCASVPWNDRGEIKTSPPTAQFAQRQGVQLAHNIAAVMRGGEPKPFRYQYMGQMAAIGEHDAVAEVFGFRFSGFLAWWMWRTVYLAKLPGVLRRLRVMIDWTFELVFPRDLSVVLPPPEDVLRAIHLVKDELLFDRGAQCRAFFYLRSGSVLLTAPDGGTRVLPKGSVLDQALLDAEGRWRWTAVAAESADLTAIRGRALKLLQTELQLTHRPLVEGS